MAETLNKDIFGLKVENHELVKLAYDTYLANSRSSHAKTLKRGEVRGGGKKPWKQKGTGRARFGSTRNPIWRHGGVDKNVVIVKDFAPKDGKVKETVKFLADNKLETGAKILFVVTEKSEMVLRATNNINTMKVVRPTYLNVFDILNADKIVISESAMPAIEAWLIGKENA